ncbi:MAG: IS91 family transposase [Gammaproteobacteria bacterium]|nr:IS91 family transposase [Gammaproteobacteria bacterium]
MAKLTIQSLLQTHLEAYLQNHKLAQYQYKALRAMRNCRTAKLGGHSVYCENGHLHGIWYNSCKHRNCPQCHGIASERWQLKLNELMLNTTHHHWVFTIPHDLLPLWRYNRALFQQLLFKCVSDTIKKLSSDNKYLGASPGYLLALHTWARNLVLHPHIHCLITHGGLSSDNQWVTPKRTVFLPAKVMMAIFRGKLLDGLRKSAKRGELILPPDSPPQQTLNLCNKLGRTDWVLHCCDPYKYGTSVAKYLGRYIKGGAVRNSQLLNMNNDTVLFRYQSHQTKHTEYLKLDVEHFIGRIINHISVPRLMSLRRFGLYHSAGRKVLNHARVHFKQSAVTPAQELNWNEYLASKSQIPCCQYCQGKLVSLIRRSARELILATV